MRIESPAIHDGLRSGTIIMIESDVVGERHPKVPLTFDRARAAPRPFEAAVERQIKLPQRW